MGHSSKRYTILYVDDEKENLTGFKFLFRRYYKVLLTTSGEDALELLKENRVQLVLADQRMPKMTGASLLSKISHLYPDITRIIVTGYSDIDGIVEAVNKGGIYYYVTKPWNAEELKMIIDRALESYQLRNDKKQLIDDLKASNKELDTFLYRSAHDLKRPLTTMLGLTQLASMSVDDPSSLDLFHKVEETAKGMNALLKKLYMVNDLKLKENEVCTVEIKELLDRIWRDFAESWVNTDSKLDYTIAEDASRFECNTVLLDNILFNLIENAIVFASNERALRVNIRVHREEDFLFLEISDNGIGIEERFLPEVFDMYFVASENTHGNGLGLYVVKRSAEQMNGSVLLSSEVGKGTTVSLQFPFFSPSTE